MNAIDIAYGIIIAVVFLTVVPYIIMALFFLPAFIFTMIKGLFEEKRKEEEEEVEDWIE